MSDSAESLHPLAQKAIDRMNNYQLVDSLVHERADGQDMLGLGELAVAGGVLVPLQSGLLAPDVLFENNLHVEPDNKLVRRMGFKAMIAFADLVGLWPEGNRGAGEAALYRMHIPVEPVTLTYVRPFTDAASEIIEKQQGLTLGFSHTSYQRIEAETDGQDEIVYGRRYEGGNRVLATAETVLHVEADEANSELTVRVTLTGPARAQLQGRHFARLTPDGLFTTPDNKDTVVSLDIPAGYEWPSNRNKAAHLQGNSALAVHDSGLIMPEDKMPAPGKPCSYSNFNPTISNAELLKLATGLPYEDVTQLLLDRYPGDLNEGLPADPAAPAHALLARGRAAIEARMQYPIEAQQPIGCLAVAALLRKGLPDVGKGLRIDPKGPRELFGRG